MLHYIIKLSISLSIVYLFYQLFLRRLTFYNWNRWYLLIYSMVCFVIPFINVFTIIVERPALRESAIVNYIPAITQMSPVAEGAGAATEAAGINWLQLAVVVFVAGVLLMIVRLLIQYYSLYKMRAKAVLLYDEKVKLYHIDEPVMPFSFGRGIYVNQHQHSEHELKEIIRHEFIHVKQRHSIDILWSELLCILNWYNPFAWLLRHHIRQNLEFIADQQILQTGLDRKQYQYLLLKVIGVNSFSIATNFNFSSLKKRIAMMNKTQSARVHLIRFLFLLPLLVVVLLAFRNTNQERRQSLKEKQIKTDTVPAASKEQARWKDVDNIDVINNRYVTIRLKNGKIEKYDMQITKEREAFEGKYGSLPEPPPHPPIPGAPGVKEHPELPEAPEKAEKPERPEAAEMPERPEIPEKPEAPEAPEPPNIIAHLDYGPSKLVIQPKQAGVPAAPEPPAAPEKATINFQDCLNKKGYCITIADNYGERVVIIKDKDNKIVEAVTLNDWQKDKKYEDKYGEIPPQQLRSRVIHKIGKPGAWVEPDKVVTDKMIPVTKVEAGEEVIVEEVPVAKVEADKVIVTKLAAIAVVGKPVGGKLVPVKKFEADKVAVSKTAEVVIVGRQAVSAKIATTQKTQFVKVTPGKIVVVGKKAEAKAVKSALSAAKADAEAAEKAKAAAEKAKAAEPQKAIPGEPNQEQ